MVRSLTLMVRPLRQRKNGKESFFFSSKEMELEWESNWKKKIAEDLQHWLPVVKSIDGSSRGGGKKTCLMTWYSLWGLHPCIYLFSFRCHKKKRKLPWSVIDWSIFHCSWLLPVMHRRPLHDQRFHGL